MNESTENKSAFILTVTSGKGGVGKSLVSVNLAAMLKKSGYRTAVIDADAGMSNCAALLNQNVRATVTDWIRGDCYLEDLPHESDHCTIVTASDDPGNMNFEPEQFFSALDQVTDYLASVNDFIIIDTPAGSGEITLWALDRSELGLLVLVNEPTAISDVYRLCKYVYSIDPGYPFACIVNFASDAGTAKNTHHRFNHILAYFLDKSTHYAGCLTLNQKIRDAVSSQQSLLKQEPEDSLVLKELAMITQNVTGLSSHSNKNLFNKPIH